MTNFDFKRLYEDISATCVSTKYNITSSESTSNIYIHSGKPTKPVITFVDKNKKTRNYIEAITNGKGISIMPNILNVRVIENTNKKNKEIKTSVVFVDFADGTSEKAVLHPDDTFSLEQGISICITKKLFSMITGGFGHSVYNKIINRGVAVYERSVKAAEDEAKRRETEEKRLANANAKIARKKAKRAAKKREYEIELRKEAYIRAMTAMAKDGKDKASEN